MEEKLRIYTVTEHFFGSIAKFLGDIGTVEVLPKNWDKIPDFKADLLVFAGGEDIDSRIYQPDDEDKSPKNRRDEWELFVLRSFLSGKLKANKVLGICRGLQLINVGLGGSLVQDIWTKFHESHKPFHGISHRKRNVFQWLNMVNSIHHQGLERFGNSNKYPLSILATEDRTGIVEIALWGNSLLGFQFHPEFFGEKNPSQGKIAELLSEWTRGKLNLLENPPSAKVVEDKGEKLRQYFASFDESREVVHPGRRSRGEVTANNRPTRIEDVQTRGEYIWRETGSFSTDTPSFRAVSDDVESTGPAFTVNPTTGTLEWESGNIGTTTIITNTEENEEEE